MMGLWAWAIVALAALIAAWYYGLIGRLAAAGIQRVLNSLSSKRAINGQGNKDARKLVVRIEERGKQLLIITTLDNTLHLQALMHISSM
jgi:hypothetical protein